MAALSFEWDSKDVEFWRGQRVEKAVARALSKAGRDALRSMKTLGAGAVRSRKQIKLNQVNKSLKTVPPKTTDIEGMEWKLEVTDRPTPLIAFPARQTRKGVVVTVNRGAPKLVAGAFIATMRTGHRGVFVRLGAARLPIKELYTSRVTDVFQDKEVSSLVLEAGSGILRQSFARLLPLELGKATSK